MDERTREFYLQGLVEKFEKAPASIEEFLDREQVPDDLRPELQRLLRTHRLLEGTGKALRELTTKV